ncbi:MAG: histidine kinase [Propionibacteriales bacterium]|nr:histidine kinase [Propionibacteriales bacterium]
MTDDDHTLVLHGTAPVPPGVAPWIVVSEATSASEDAGPGPRRIVGTVVIGALVVLVVVAVLGVIAARTLAERQSVNAAANTVDLLAEAVVQPALRDAILDDDPAAVQRLAAAVRDSLTATAVIRVKLWTEDGRILYSDESRLVGQQFVLDDEARAVFAHPSTRAEISDLDKPENVYERGQGKLLEAYRPVWTPNGTPLLFETYSPYDEVDQQTSQLWRGFAGVTVSSLLLFAALMVPLLWQLMTRVRGAQRQREDLLQRAVDASVDERRRIAGTLHDGVVQELAGASFALSGAASRVESMQDDDLATDVRRVAGTLRDSIGGLRTLLVDIYPATLDTAGILDVLGDLAATLRSRDIDVHLDLPDEDPGLGPERDQLVFRIVHECLQNVQRHSGAANLWLRLAPSGSGHVLEISDDGVGFDPAAVLASPEEGHFGLRVLADVAGREGAELAVSSAPGAGCRWRLSLP